jgi:hypothetical protein
MACKLPGEVVPVPPNIKRHAAGKSDITYGNEDLYMKSYY